MALFEIERCECGGRTGRPLHLETTPACASCAEAGAPCGQIICTDCGGRATGVMNLLPAPGPDPS